MVSSNAKQEGIMIGHAVLWPVLNSHWGVVVESGGVEAWGGIGDFAACAA